MANEMRYETGKRADGKWGVFFRMDARTSFDQGLTFRTKREAETARAAFQREYDAERSGQ